MQLLSCSLKFDFISDFLNLILFSESNLEVLKWNIEVWAVVFITKIYFFFFVDI